MPLEAPKLDNRSYEQIKELVRSRIPRYAPQWTDYNESDPGATFIELFSWLSEMMLYQMNQVPERNYIKFLKLLNMELRPPIAAQAHLSFKVQAGSTVKPVALRSQVAAQSAETGELVIFETDKGLDLISHPLTDVQVYDGAAFTVVTQLNSDQDDSYRPLGWVPQIGSALYLGFEPPDPLPPSGQAVFPQQLRFRVFLPTATQAGEAQACKEVAQPPSPPVSLVWEYRHPGSDQKWRRLTLYEDETAAFTREGYILIEGPAEIATSVEGKVKEAPRYWLRCRLESGAYPAGQEPEIDLFRINTVSARNLSSVHEEILGASEGHPKQTFELRRKPVLKESLELRIEAAGLEPQTWLRVDDFLASGAEDPHYTLNAAAGRIEFGDGEHGRIPVAGAQIIATQYRYGGGAIGNVGADTITLPLTTLVGVESVSNARAAVGGRDEQALEDLKFEAPAVLRHRNRAVTPEDFAALAVQAGGVAKSAALALAHPDFPGVRVPGAVSIVIVPDNEEMPPRPSSDLIRHVCNYLDGFRLLTTEQYVKGPTYIEIRVQTRVVAKPYIAAGTVEQLVREALDDRLDPMEWEFGQDFYPTGLFRDILRVSNEAGDEVVTAVTDLSISVEGVKRDDLSEPVILKPDELIYPGEHEIIVVSQADR